MNNELIFLLESFMLVFALSLDAFVASFAYGTSKIKIPVLSAFMIDIVCTFTLGLSLFCGEILKPFIPDGVTNIICFVVIFLIGIVKLFDSSVKAYIKKSNSIHRTLSFSFMNFNFILDMYANPEKADKDTSKVLSPVEAVPLAFALSLDGIAVGLGAALSDTNHLQVVAFSLIINLAMVFIGCFVGNKVAEKTSIDLSWVSGIILIILALLKL